MQSLDVLVIGARQAGLALGYHLKQTPLRFHLIERNRRVGDSWRNRYDSKESTMTIGTCYTSTRSGLGRKLARELAYALVFILPPLLAGVGVFAVKAQQIVSGEPPVLTEPLPAPPPHDPAKLTAVIVTSNHGTEITDSLPPYEILAASGAFNVYFVAPEHRVSPLDRSATVSRMADRKLHGPGTLASHSILPPA